jgi:hypothetical protein
MKRVNTPGSFLRCLVTLVATLGLLVFAIACGATRLYEGPARAETEIAIIHDDFQYYAFFWRHVLVETVNGKSTVRFLRGLKTEVPPGRHTLGVRFRDYRFGQLRVAKELCWIDFHATAGGEYKFESETSGDVWQIWLSDKQTGEQTFCDYKQPGQITMLNTEKPKG